MAPSGSAGGKRKSKKVGSGTPNPAGSEGTGKEGRAMYDERPGKIRITYGNERLDPNSSYNQNKGTTPQGTLNPATGLYESEVNPEVRQNFEAKYGEGATFGKDETGYSQDITTGQEKSSNIPQATNTNEPWYSTIPQGLWEGVQNFLTYQFLGLFAGLMIVGGPLAGAGAGILGTLIGADTLTNWAGLDNVMGQSSIMTTKLVSEMGQATPEQRTQILAAAESAKANADAAKNKIETSMMVDPAMYPFAKLWLTAVKQSDEQINRNLFAIKNYNPLQDRYSREYQLQTYGQPKYDTQGNPKQ